MRSTRLLVLVLAVVAGGCGDDNNATPMDSAPDTGIGTKCDDGIDNDGDGKVDFPADPGCAVPNADDETDDCPDGAGCPQCGNGRDDDGNGLTDYPADPGCSSASDATEVVDDPVACGATLMIKNLPATGTDSGMLTTASTSQVSSTCGGGGGAAAIAYRINLSQPAVIVASTAGSTFDTVLDLREADCDDSASEIACHDDVSASNETSQLTASLAAGTYFLIIEGSDTSEIGNYTLTVDRFLGEGVSCSGTAQCGPGLVCRTPLGAGGDVCTKPQCADTLDDDGDGKNGYPTDPGCASLADNDETDPDPLPACSNGMDDDGDGMMDYPADTSCSSAGGNSEACNGEQDPIGSISMGTTTGTLVGAHDDHESECDANDGGEDLLYTLTIPAMRQLQIDTEGSSIDTVLSLMAATCTEPGIACDDQGGTSTNSSRMVFNNFLAGTYIVAVDNFSGDDAPGPYNLHVSGIIAPGGSCEPELTLGGALECPPMNPCEGTAGSMKCRPTLCGDGLDNDSPADGLIDFPDDPGCSSLDDNDETDTCPGAGAGCPECADGVDNDGDNDVDENDGACLVGGMYIPSIPSEGCLSTEPVTPLTLPLVAGNTSSDTDDFAPACGGSTNDAPDHTYSVQLPAMRNFTIAADTDFDGVAAFYDSTCGGTALSCSDTPETISVNNIAAGNYFFVIDGYDDSDDNGAYSLSVSGTIQNGASCEVPLAISGAITCGTGFACKGASGARICQKAACGDGLDNDGDGVADFPNDPGCGSASDDDETDTCPGGANCPVCSDGLDNDSDSLVDYPDDPQCPSASGISESCNSSEGYPAIALAVTPGATSGAVNDTRPSCGSSSHSAPDRMYSLTVPALTNLHIEGNTSFDAVVALYDGTCSATDLACEDDEVVDSGPLAAGMYFVVVDGWSSGSGTYSLTIDGSIARGESCEGALALAGALHCSIGDTCAGTMGSRTCQVAQCSDGMDNDQDGATDFPFEPGCDNPSDNDETDPATAPVCSNTMDDDNDQLTDFPMDYGCESAASTTEEFCSPETDMTNLITTTPMTGTTVGATDNFSELSCAFFGDSEGADVTLALQLPVPVTSIDLSLLGSSFDTELSLQSASCGTELACNEDDDDADELQSTIHYGALAAGSYAVIIDGFAGDEGTYTLAVTGTVAAGTDCSSTLFTNGVLACPSGTTCTGTPMRCQ